MSRKERLVGKKDSKLQRLLAHVCSDGYVKYRGLWFKGLCSNPEDIDCSKCDFAGCDAQ